MTALDVLVQDVDEMIEARKDAIVNGQTKTYDEYMHLCGVVMGLKLVRERAVELNGYEEE